MYIVTHNLVSNYRGGSVPLKYNFTFPYENRHRLRETMICWKNKVRKHLITYSDIFPSNVGYKKSKSRYRF